MHHLNIFDIHSLVIVFKYVTSLVRNQNKMMLDLLHYLWELCAESLSSMIIKYLLQSYVLQSNQGCLQHVKTSLICKGKNGQCLQELLVLDKTDLNKG